METLDILQKLSEYGLSFLLLGVAVWYFTKQIGKKELEINQLQTDLKDYSKDYRSLADQSLKVLVLVDDKLKTDITGNETIKDIHRMVGEILEQTKKRS